MGSKKTEQAQHSMELINRAQIPPFYLVRRSLHFLIYSSRRPQRWPVNVPITQVLLIVTATSMRLGTVTISFCRQKTKHNGEAICPRRHI